MVENSLISLFYRVRAKDVLAETGDRPGMDGSEEENGGKGTEPFIQKMCVLNDHILRGIKGFV